MEFRCSLGNASFHLLKILITLKNVLIYRCVHWRSEKKKVQLNKMYLEFSCPGKILVNPKLLLILEEIIIFFFSSFQNSFLSPVESWRHKASLETKILSMAESGENFQHG